MQHSLLITTTTNFITWLTMMTTRHFMLLLLSLLVVSHSFTTCKGAPRMKFEAIYQFGDSLSDTGNLIREARPGRVSTYAKLPYGESLFQRPTGRCSDGLIMVDYFAIYFGLPLLNPYLSKGSDFSNGVNFAVAGATALSTSALAKKNISSSTTNSSLGIQLAWFKAHLKTICSSPEECKQKLQKALVLMGEIGGNDFNFGFSQGRTLKEAFALVPDVVQTIKDAVEEVITLGAVNVVVPGNFPIGCVPLYLVEFPTNDSSKYDDLNCLKAYNHFSMFYNARLRKAIKELQVQHPGVAIVYGDYFAALRWVIKHSTTLGFEKGGWHRACCASGDNPYNYSLGRGCGSPGVPVCPDPTKRLSWDGIHMTQQGNKYVANWLLKHFVPSLRPPIHT